VAVTVLPAMPNEMLQFVLLENTTVPLFREAPAALIAMVVAAG